MIKKLFTKRERIIFYFAIGAVVFSIFFVSVIFPALQKAEQLNKEIAVGRARVKKYIRLLSRKDYIRNKYAADYKPAITSQDRGLSVLSVIEKIAKESDIQLIDIRPQSQREISQDKENEIFMDIKTEGGLQGHMRFIYAIENSLFILRIKRMQLEIKPGVQTLEGRFSVSQLFIAD